MLKTPQKETATRDNPTYLIKHLTKRHIKERGERAMGQKDEKSRQESLPESFQIQGKLPTENNKSQRDYREDAKLHRTRQSTRLCLFVCFKTPVG